MTYKSALNLLRMVGGENTKTILKLKKAAEIVSRKHWGVADSHSVSISRENVLKFAKDIVNNRYPSIKEAW